MGNAAADGAGEGRSLLLRRTVRRRTVAGPASRCHHPRMPELPDVTVYVEALDRRLTGSRLSGVRVAGPSLLQTFDPPLTAVAGARILGFRRVGKRIVFALDGKLFLVVHLMIAGRFRWKERGAAIPRKLGLAAFDTADATVLLTEAGTKKRAMLHLVRGEDSLAGFDRGGIDVFTAGTEEFSTALTAENHTLKRALTDPRILDGIGNAYSDEILHRARLSPLKWTRRLDGEELARLHGAARAVLREWIERLREETGDGFPEGVTAFREGMAVHGKYGRPCPACGSPVQRIVYASNETNYCPRCQTGGKLLADRALSRLLRGDWPGTLEELEARKGP